MIEDQVKVRDQNTQQIEQNSVGQPTATAEKPKINFLMIGGIILICFLVFGIGGYYLGKKSTNTQPTIDLSQQSAPSGGPSIIAPSPTSTPVVNKTSLSDALSQYCTNNKIALDKLPFTLSQTLKNDYKVQDKVECYAPNESYATISMAFNKLPELSGDKRNIYFFHQDSKFQGMGNYLQPLSNYKEVTINGQNLYLNVVEPGPYGISTLGVWVDFIVEKKDSATGTIVRIFNLEIFKDQDILDLVKKYGVKLSDASGPEYIISDPDKKAQFIQEIFSLAGQHAAFRKPAQDVSSDLEGVSF